VQPNLVKKVVFPLELLPIVPILSALIESALGLAVLIVAVAIISHSLYPTLALLPLIWLPQLLFTVGLGYLSAGLTVFVRDIPQSLAVVLNLWFYLTPIVYPLDVVPESFQRWVFWLNPLSAIVQIYRDLVIVGEVNHGWQWLWLFLVSLLFAGLGVSVYQRLRHGFADVL
jgi:lipopolysaccharide transport system permease protein